MKTKYLSLKEAYGICLQIADTKAHIYKRTIALYIVAFFAQGLIFSFFYPIIKNILEKNYDGALLWLYMIVGLSIVFAIAKWYAHEFDYTGNVAKINHDLRLKIGDKMRSMPLEKLYTYRTGELNSVLSSGVDESVLMMGFVSGMVLEIFIVPSVVVITTLFIDFRLGVALLVALPLAIPLYKIKRRYSFEEKGDLRKANQALESDAIEYIQGLNILKSLNLVGENSKKLIEGMKKVKTVQEEGLYKAILPMASVNMLIEGTILLILCLGVYFALGGSLNVALLIALIVWISRISEPLSIFLAIGSVVDIIDIAFKSIKSILSIEDLPIQGDKIPQHFHISFENVDFSYAKSDKKALKNLNFKIPSNSLTAIVGDSGSGKTTITKLIMRFADPQEGSIKLGDIDIKQMSAKTLMSNISTVFQDVYLLDDTILNNIRMGRSGARDEEVKEAAKSAFCHEFITRLPKGYDTKVGEIGGSLSGGEKQRISIARAILKNAPIVILDEPTSALDTESEVAVQKAINALMRDKTVIVIAHRLSTITNAKQILVLDEGNLVQKGVHEELVAQRGKYKRMYEANLRNKEWHIA